MSIIGSKIDKLAGYVDGIKGRAIEYSRMASQLISQNETVKPYVKVFFHCSASAVLTAAFSIWQGMPLSAKLHRIGILCICISVW